MGTISTRMHEVQKYELLVTRIGRHLRCFKQISYLLILLCRLPWEKEWWWNAGMDHRHGFEYILLPWAVTLSDPSSPDEAWQFDSLRYHRKSHPRIIRGPRLPYSRLSNGKIGCGCPTGFRKKIWISLFLSFFFPLYLLSFEIHPEKHKFRRYR